MTHRLRIVFAGTPDFAVPPLDALHAAGHELVAAYTQPDRPAGRGQQLAASPVKRRAVELGIAVEQPVSLRQDDAVARLRDYRPDLMVVVAYGLILPQPVLDVPRIGCWNHPRRRRAHRHHGDADGCGPRYRADAAAA